MTDTWQILNFQKSLCDNIEKLHVLCIFVDITRDMTYDIIYS